MNVVGRVAFVILVCRFASAAEQIADPEPLVGIQNLKNSLNTKTEVVGRFFKLLTSGSKPEVSTEKPRDESLFTFPFIGRTFRRLNIFGLQAPPDEPTKSSNGTLSKPDIPDILRVVSKFDDEDVSNFYVVQPLTNFEQVDEELFDHHYPKLNIDGLLREEELREPESTKPSFGPDFDDSYQPHYVQRYW